MIEELDYKHVEMGLYHVFLMFFKEIYALPTIIIYFSITILEQKYFFVYFLHSQHYIDQLKEILLI